MLSDQNIFLEKLYLGEGFGTFLRREAILYQEKTKYQEIEIILTEKFGKVLLLDGIIQLTEADEAHYHEMLVHVPMLVHPHPKSVVIIGGGDGGALREVCRHSAALSILLVEIDPAVPKAVRQHFGREMTSGFSDSRTEILFMDGLEFLRDAPPGIVDVIIVDSPDPVGPGENLYKEEFYSGVKRSLALGGIAVFQMESIFYNLPFIRERMRILARLFPQLRYYWTMVPTYPSGGIGFAIASTSYYALDEPNNRRWRAFAGEYSNLKYYYPEIHSASFVLPKFVGCLR